MRRLFLFAHFDQENLIKPFILDHIRALRDLGEVAFVSNSHLPEEECSKLSGLVSSILLRENTGYDFSMWKEALRRQDCQGYDELVLTNSSILGPFRPLAEIFAQMENQQCDFWGLTENHDIAFHLQSFFLVFRRQVLDSEAFKEFWASILPFRNKEALVSSYEVGLTAFLQDQGFKGLAAFPIKQLKSNPLRDIAMGRKPRFRIHAHKNPTLYYPDLLMDIGMPYLKVDLFKRNPNGLNLNTLRRILRSHHIALDHLD